MFRRNPAWKLSKTTSFQTIRQEDGSSRPPAARPSLISTVSMMWKILVVHAPRLTSHHALS